MEQIYIGFNLELLFWLQVGADTYLLIQQILLNPLVKGLLLHGKQALLSKI
jgi:hypothetical protein